ncbi:MAG: biotin--[acetyl-CoA-carboxylase] ligase [Elusimicrobia bacterium]|nr:biotin--[acetyl-CoA-carboxylase] ligase [Elusimicrobiota bacterium]
MKLPDITQLIHLSQTDSTQSLAKELAQKGYPEGTLVWANRQTHGRGRLDRKWHSPKGGLYCTLILRPRCSPSQLGKLNLLVARAMSNTLHKMTRLQTIIKPPNDILARSKPAEPYKKVCGILTEAYGNGKKTDWALMGIGINVNNSVPKNLKNAASLSHLLNRELDIE